MSTVIPVCALALAFVGSVSLANAPAPQGGVGPIKLQGAATLVYDNGTKQFGKKTIYYDFVVELNTTSPVNTVVTITDSTGGAIHHPQTVTVLAGQLTRHFNVWALDAPDSGTLSASNAYYQASMNVETVLP